MIVEGYYITNPFRIPITSLTKQDLSGVVAPDGQTTRMGYSNKIFFEAMVLKLNGPIKRRGKILARLGACTVLRS